MTFNNLRTDKSFCEKSDEDYHKGNSPLEQFEIDITYTVVLDYMHCVCLGVMKRILVFWCKGPKHVRLSNPDINTILTELLNLHSMFSSEFCRLLRSLEEIEFWKATEFRSFLLYTGPIVLRGRQKKKFYLHFHSAIRFLISSETCFIYNDLTNTLLRTFVDVYSNLYGREYISYNVHSLIHLSNFVKTTGHLIHLVHLNLKIIYNLLRKVKKILSTSYKIYIIV